MLAATEQAQPHVIASGAKDRVSGFIDYGVVTIARIGAPKRFNANAAIGTTRTCIKMLRFAKAGEIVIGESAKTLLPRDW